MTDRLIAPLSDEERTAFIAAVRSFMTSGPDGLPVRYRHRGRDYRGVDCIGIPVYAMGVVGRDVRDMAVYSPAPDGHTLRDALIAHLGQPISPAEMQPGDIPLMRWYQPRGVRMFNHVGVITSLAPYTGGDLVMVHAYMGNKEVTEHGIGEPWKRRIVEAYRP